MTEPRINIHLNMSGTLTLANFMKIASLIEAETYEVGLGNVALASTHRSQPVTVSEAIMPEVIASGTQNSPEASEPVEADSGEIDAHGWPWSAELHASTKGQTKDGLWRMKVGVTRPDPKPGFPKGETPSETSTPSPATTDAAGATAQAGSTQTAEATSAAASLDADDDEFAAFREAAAKVDAADAQAAASVPARVWTDADLGALCNQAAVKLGDPAPVKALIAEFVPAGEVAHSRNVPADKRGDFVAAVEAKAGIEFAG